MKIHHYGIPLSVAALLLPVTLGSCSDDFDRPEMTSPEGLGFEFSAVIEQDNSSRADESGFADGDRFGAYVVNYSGGQPGQLALTGNQVNNVAIGYTADDNQWTPATPIYWLDDKTPADVYAYYPFTNGMSDVEAHRFEVSADQSIAGTDGDMGTYEASDFLWAKASRVAPGTRINLSFSHRLAGVKVVLEQGSGFAEGEWEKLPRTVTVDNTVRTAYIDLSTGTATVNGTFDRHVTMNSDATDSYRAVVVPQSVAAGKSTIGITIDGTAYNYTRGEGMTYTAGKLHVFTLRVDKQEQSGDYALSLVSEDITPWESDNSSHDFEANSYLVVDVPTAGTLKECLAKTGADFSTVKNLKVTGQLTDADFRFMREEMSELTAVNLKEVKMVNVEYKVQIEGADYWDWPDDHMDDMLPNEAFSNKGSIRRLIIPDGIKRIGAHAFSHLRLTSTLVIPESVTRIDTRVFESIGEEGTIILPNSLEYIAENAFLYAHANFEFKLTNTIKYIGDGAFQGATGATGTFNVPNKIEYLGSHAFDGCGHDLTGDIVIPTGLTEIPDAAFSTLGFSQGTNLTLPEGIKRIGISAFQSIRFLSSVNIPESVTTIAGSAFKNSRILGGGLKLPENVKYIGRAAFSTCNITGTLEFPRSMDLVLGGEGDNEGAFCATNLEKIIIGDNILQIEKGAFSRNQSLKSVELGKNVGYIGDRAFATDSYPFGMLPVETVICHANEPPKVGSDAFLGIYFDKCILEVPEKSVELYRNADGWRQFQNITPYHELAFNIPDIVCLDKGITREGVIRAEGSWSIIECPSWVHVTPDHADYKENLTVKIDPLPAGEESREGEIVFKLDDKDYTTYTSVRQHSYEHLQDTEIILQSASAGNDEIPMFIVGEGFNADNIVSGEYLRVMNETMEQFFSIEPYKSYRDYFTVATAIACSPDEGTGDVLSTKINCFGTDAVEPDSRLLKEYAAKVSARVGNNMGNAIIIMVSNYNCFHGWSDINDDGCSMAAIGRVDDFYPYDQRGLVQHFAGGEAFAGLGNEMVTHFEHIKGCTCPACSSLGKFNSMKSRGYFANLTMSSKMSDAPWNEFIFHPKYSSMVDMWEGGYNHIRGVWRSEANSVMNTYIAYFNTISRYTIYQEIMRRAGLNASLDEFIANDKIEIPQ